MNKEGNILERREISTEDIENLIKLITTFREEIRNFENTYYGAEGSQEIDYKVYYNRFLIPTRICVDIILFSTDVLRRAFNLPEGCRFSFSGTEHIFTCEPDSVQDFLTRINFLKTTLMPLASVYLHSIKNPLNHNGSSDLVDGISRVVYNAIYMRGNGQANWDAINAAGDYFSRKD